MKRFILTILSFLPINIYCQEMRVTHICDNTFEVSIYNPDNLWLFMPKNCELLPFGSLKNNKHSHYEFSYEITDKNGNNVCLMLDMVHREVKQVYDFGFSGQFNNKKNITYIYTIQDDLPCDNHNFVYIQFMIIHRNIAQNKDLKSWVKLFNKNNIFNGELCSNKVLLNFKE